MSARILFLTPTLNLGGAERSLVKAATHMAIDGVQVAIAVLCQGTHRLESELPPAVEVFELNARSTASPLLWWKVRHLVSRWRPTTVCGWSMYANLVGVVATWRMASVRVALSERNFLPRMLARSRVGRVRRAILKRAIYTLYRRADIITANSEQSTRALRRFLKGNAEYSVLPNLVDIRTLDRLASQELKQALSEGPEIRLVAVGRLDRQKGFDVLLAALSQIEAACCWRLVVVGDGPMRAELERLVGLLRFPRGRIVLAPATVNPFPYYAWSDVVIVPSRFEGFPNVALEAMAVGRPIVASRCRSGPAELTSNGTYGVLVRPEDPIQLANAIQNICDNPQLRLALGAAAREHVKNTYTWGRVMPAYRKLTDVAS